jgi:hypothetical protein
VCEGGTACRHDPRTGLDAVACTCATPLASACPGVTLPAPIQSLSTKACGFFARAAGATPKRERRNLLRGAKALAKAVKRVGRSAGLPAGCAAALDTRFNGALTGARALADRL